MIRPLGDKIIVQDKPPKTKTQGGIVLPRETQISTEAVVLAVGPGRIIREERFCYQRNPMPVWVGDIVLVAKGGTPIEQDGVKCRIVDVQDIVAVRNT